MAEHRAARLVRGLVILRLEVVAETKNDGLTTDSERDELLQILADELTESLDLPWIIDLDVRVASGP